MKIEKMSFEDIDQVMELAHQLGYPNSRTEIKNRFELIQDHPDYALFVAKTSRVVGFIQINLEPVTLLIGTRADVAAFVIDEQHRGQGIGKQLLKQAEEWAREKSIPLVRIRSNVKREDTRRFYLREGYELSKIANFFTKKI